MNPKDPRRNVTKQTPGFYRIKERHNLILYLCLMVIAFIFIIAPPAQASAGDLNAQPDQLTLFTPDQPVLQENSCFARIAIATPVLPVNVDSHEANR
jgi:hypothetical protein